MSLKSIALKSTLPGVSSTTLMSVGSVPTLVGSSLTATTCIFIKWLVVTGSCSAAHAKTFAANMSLAVEIVPPPVMFVRKIPSSEVNKM